MINRQLSHKLITKNGRKTAWFRLHVGSTGQTRNYEKMTCKFRFVSDDSPLFPLMDFQKHGAMAPIVGFWNSIRMLERLDWTGTKILRSPGELNEEKTIGAVNLFSNVNRDGALEIKCEVEITGLRLKTDSGLLAVRQTSKSINKLAQDVGKLLASEELADVTLVVEDREIKVHQLILAARSPVFNAMLSVDMREKREKRITIPDVSYVAAKEFLEFIYSAQLKTTKNAKDLLILAEMYQITDLKNACENILVAQLNKENALDYLYAANLYSCKPKLKKKAFEIIAK